MFSSLLALFALYHSANAVQHTFALFWKFALARSAKCLARLKPETTLSNPPTPPRAEATGKGREGVNPSPGTGEKGAPKPGKMLENRVPKQSSPSRQQPLEPRPRGRVGKG